MPLKEVNRKYSNEGERKRLAEPMGESFTPPWFKWGPYVSERSWGTVREDYSANGDAWSYFPFDDAYRKAYRWGDDAIAGWCDRYQILIFAPVFWNGKDVILKERLFGLSSSEGNHGEDVKEQYFHVDATPTHSYMKYLYKYPIDEFPYQKLKEENKNRDSFQSEYELIDTGVFDNDRYFDIFIEYVKVSSEDTIVKIEAFNRSNQVAPLHLIPHLWFRNRWSWFENPGKKPEIYKGCSTKDYDCLIANDESSDKLSNLPFEYTLDKRYLYFQKGGEILFTDNETCHQEHKHTHNHYKDAFNRHIIQGDPLAYNERGTKACVHYKFACIQPKSSVVVYLRLTDEVKEDPFYKINEIIDRRKTEADEFYEGIHPKKASSEEKMIQRQALSSLIWNKQIYLYDISLWLDGDNKKMPPPASRKYIRNQHWRHLNSMRILSMPDKWEYPWFAAWDLAFQCVGWALIDTKFAKDQIWLLLFDQFQHPNGQIPAYEWEFSDLNPPIQAWAALKVFLMEFEQTGNKDIVFLEKCFHKLLMNFSWWVNKVDSAGNNVFEGGFLGLDNIAVLDRSSKLPHGIILEQSDGTGWMAFFCLNLMRMSMELSSFNKVYESLATKFFEHYVYIAHAMKTKGGDQNGLWDSADGFFYDILTYPDGGHAKFRVRSLVGIIPIFAVDYFSESELVKYPDFHENFHWFLRNRPDLIENSVITRNRDNDKIYILTPMNKSQLESILKYVWDPNEFRSNFGLRSLSKYHEQYPFEFEGRKVIFEPAESSEKIKGGNSNWRGPIWFPTSFLLIESLYKLSAAMQDDIKIQVSKEDSVTLHEMAVSFSERMLSLFKKDQNNIRPFFGPQFPYALDKNWQDYIHFYEYFHSEIGKGLGASNQCGWTVLIANLIQNLRK